MKVIEKMHSGCWTGKPTRAAGGGVDAEHPYISVESYKNMLVSSSISQIDYVPQRAIILHSGDRTALKTHRTKKLQKHRLILSEFCRSHIPPTGPMGNNICNKHIIGNILWFLRGKKGTIEHHVMLLVRYNFSIKSMKRLFRRDVTITFKS